MRVRFSAGAGCHVLKPRGSSHCFWNAGATTVRYLETSCGMVLGESPEATTHYRNVAYGFCSVRCRLEFLGAPERYARKK